MLQFCSKSGLFFSRWLFLLNFLHTSGATRNNRLHWEQHWECPSKCWRRGDSFGKGNIFYAKQRATLSQLLSLPFQKGWPYSQRCYDNKLSPLPQRGLFGLDLPPLWKFHCPSMGCVCIFSWTKLFLKVVFVLMYLFFFSLKIVSFSRWTMKQVNKLLFHFWGKSITLAQLFWSQYFFTPPL